MRELALHLLDIAENSVSAQARNINIRVEETTPQYTPCPDRLIMTVMDDGVGMDTEMVQRVVDPFVTSRTTRKVGMGIPLLKAAAEGCNGCLSLESTKGKGTRLEVTFQRSHIDRMPLGNLADTILTLVVGSPEIHWVFIYKVNDQIFVFDNQVIMEAIGEISCCDPAILGYIRQTLEDGIHSIQTEEILTFHNSNSSQGGFVPGESSQKQPLSGDRHG